MLTGSIHILYTTTDHNYSTIIHLIYIIKGRHIIYYMILDPPTAAADVHKSTLLRVWETKRESHSQLPWMPSLEQMPLEQPTFLRI